MCYCDVFMGLVRIFDRLGTLCDIAMFFIGLVRIFDILGTLCVKVFAMTSEGTWGRAHSGEVAATSPVSISIQHIEGTRIRIRITPVLETGPGRSHGRAFVVELDILDLPFDILVRSREE